MRLGVFVSYFRFNTDTYDRLRAEKLGVIFVQNGVYHATVKENGKTSPLLEKSADFYALKEDLETNGFKSSDVDSRVKVVTFNDLVDVMFNDYEKLVWL
ncbi:MAG: DsrH/TusB family sulfur metabolism protein [Nitrospirota bacterium]